MRIKWNRIFPEMWASTRWRLAMRVETWCWATILRPCPLLQLRLSAPCQDFRTLLGYQDRVFKMSRRHPVRRANCPAVIEQFNRSSAGINHRLDGERHPRLQSRAAPTSPVIRDLRLLVQFPPDPVPDKFADYIEALARRDFLDGRANIAQPGTFMHHLNRAAKSRLGHSQQPLRALVDHADRNREGGIPYPAVLDYPDVELHDVAILDPALTADAVHDFVV